MNSSTKVIIRILSSNHLVFNMNNQFRYSKNSYSNVMSKVIMRWMKMIINAYKSSEMNKAHTKEIQVWLPSNVMTNSIITWFSINIFKKLRHHLNHWKMNNNILKIKMNQILLRIVKFKHHMINLRYNCMRIDLIMKLTNNRRILNQNIWVFKSHLPQPSKNYQE